LREVGQIVRSVDGSGIGTFHPGEQAQQGGLADPVLADQPEPVAGPDGQVDAVQHHPSGVGLADVAGEQGNTASTVG